MQLAWKFDTKGIRGGGVGILGIYLYRHDEACVLLFYTAQCERKSFHYTSLKCVALVGAARKREDLVSNYDDDCGFVRITHTLY